MTQPPRSDETIILGAWIDKGGSIEGDDVCNRIEVLISEYLRKVGAAMDDWSTLYIDLSDGRYWELTYPKSELHGSGPPMLSVIDKVEANRKYGI